MQADLSHLKAASVLKLRVVIRADRPSQAASVINDLLVVQLEKLCKSLAASPKHVLVRCIL